MRRRSRPGSVRPKKPSTPLVASIIHKSNNAFMKDGRMRCVLTSFGRSKRYNNLHGRFVRASKTKFDCDSRTAETQILQQFILALIPFQMPIHQ